MTKETMVIDNDIVKQLENNGLKKSDKDQQIKMLLTHVYMAVKMYWGMSREDRALASEWHKKFRRSFSLRKFLKERKTNSRKNYLPPAPPMLKKEYKEKTDKNPPTERVKRTLKVRQEEFWNELLTFEGMYDRQTLTKFYYYWAEQVTGRRKMRLELETSWNTGYRLAGWTKRSYQAIDEAATIKLERVKKGNKQVTASGNTEAQRIEAARREEANERLEREIEERKKNAVTYEDYLASKKKQNEES